MEGFNYSVKGLIHIPASILSHVFYSCPQPHTNKGNSVLKIGPPIRNSQSSLFMYQSTVLKLKSCYSFVNQNLYPVSSFEIHEFTIQWQEYLMGFLIEAYSMNIVFTSGK
jgi:hypothetical protein